MQVQFKRLRPDAVKPTYGSTAAAGLDLSYPLNAQPITLFSGQLSILVGTGIAIHLGDPNTVAMIYPRSGLGHKKGLVLGNGTGVIDADYQGELMVSLCVRPMHEQVTINPGDRIAQLVIMPIIRANLEEVYHWTGESARATGGFGSTGA